jgi:nucleotide-binding universal stress UspA family protein
MVDGDSEEIDVKTIVVGVDGSEGSKAALKWTLEQAAHQRDARVVVLSAWVPAIPASSPWYAAYDIPAELQNETQAAVEAMIAEVGGAPDGVDVEVRVVRGSTVGALMDAGRAADVLVVGSRGLGGFKGLLLGSVSQQIVTHAPCPTVVVPSIAVTPDSDDAGARRIVVGVDRSRNSAAALEWAAYWARASGAPIRVVSVWRHEPMVVSATHPGVGWPSDTDLHAEAQRELEAFVSTSDLPADVTIETHTREGEPARILLEQAAHAGLLVVGARGHGGFMGLLLGSVATAVVHHCPCPVAVIPCGRDAY